MSRSEDPDRLFDWAADPFELIDPLASNKDVAKSMQDQIDELLQMFETRGQVLAGGEESTDEPLDPEQLEQLRSLGYVD